MYNLPFIDSEIFITTYIINYDICAYVFMYNNRDLVINNEIISQ